MELRMFEITANNIRMTSQEIADLVGKRHDNVKRTIETIANQGVISLPQIEEVKIQRERRAESVSAYVFTGEQGKRDSIVVVAQLSPEFTARLVDRWQELESANKPKTTLEIIAAQTQVLIAQEREITRLKEVQAEQEDRIVRVEAKQNAFEEGFKYFTVLGYAAYKGITIDLTTAQSVGKKAAQLSRTKSVPIDKVSDPRFGRVNSYHETVLDEIISEMFS